MIHRLIPTELFPQTFDKKLRIIKQIAYNNDFVTDLINNIIRNDLERKEIAESYARVANDVDREKKLKHINECLRGCP